MLLQQLQMSPKTRREPTRAGLKRLRYGLNGSTNQLSANADIFPTGSELVPDFLSVYRKLRRLLYITKH